MSNLAKLEHFIVDVEADSLIVYVSGSIDNWYFLEGGAPLKTLAEKYVRHLGRESFFELM